MLTKVILDGPLGKKFGKTWNLDVGSPNEALKMIDANKPGVFGWIKTNLQKYSRYQVICEYDDGRIEHLENDSYQFERKAKTIRFVPVIEGAGGGILQTVLGAVLIVVGVVTEQPSLIWAGAAMMIGGVAAMLAPKPNVSSSETSDSSSKNKSSYYFDGPANTTAQGVPVQLIYGRCLVGSHAISARATVEQLL